LFRPQWEPVRKCRASKFRHARLQVLPRRSLHKLRCVDAGAFSIGKRNASCVGLGSTGGVTMAINSGGWRQRADEMRKIADQTRDRHAKETMLGIAHEYELLAGQFENLENWQRGAPAPGVQRV